MPGKIFISYRREDVAGDARGLHDALARKFGKSSVFMDVDNLLAGQRFDKELDKALAACDVLIAVIGPRWMHLLTERHQSGQRDYVRDEIAAALKRGIVVIPVRVGGEGRLPPLPRADELPEDIRELVLHQKHDVVHEKFGRDVSDLMKAIAIVREPPPVLWRWIAAGIAAVAVVASVTVYVVRLGPGSATVRDGVSSVSAPGPSGSAKGGAPLLPALEPIAMRQPKPLTADEERVLQRSDAFKECLDCPVMVVVPAGSFTMGTPDDEGGRMPWAVITESPERKVTIGRPFAVGKFEVTFAEWDACVVAGGCRYYPSDEKGRGNLPVIHVSWDDIAKEYLPWLSHKTGKTYRLLTEAEWEYAARADTKTPFWWGSSISTKQANYYGDQTYGGGPKGEYRRWTVPVDSFAPNPWGLYNVHGNVWEWVQDCFKYDKDYPTYQGAPTDGSAWTTPCSEYRIMRGGSWNDPPNDLRSASRGSGKTDDRRIHIGFRVARTLTP